MLSDHYISADTPEFNRRRLFLELKNARMVPQECMPLNVVCANSRVLVTNLDKRQTFSIRIVPSDYAILPRNELSVTDPLVIALLGYAAGASTEWEMKDGINRLKVMSVWPIEDRHH